MNYLARPLGFKIAKVGRYCLLYGPRRTLAKIRGQVHMHRRLDVMPRSLVALKASQVVGIIGCGNYAFSNIAYFLTRKYGRVIGGCMDIDPHRAASLAQYYGIPFHTTDAAALIEHPEIRLLYIASNHASHAEYALQALRCGKDVYIEKPHVVNEDQLVRLIEAAEQSQGRVYLGFNRPGSRFGRLIAAHLEREAGTAMFNWFVAGHAIDPDHWYFRPEEGGRVLGNLCHWTDFLYVMAGANPFPTEVRPTRAAKSDCDIAVSYVFRDGSIGSITFSAKGHTFEGVKERLCVHKGNCLIVMDDFSRMTIEVLDQKRRYRNLFRDHGHEANILGAYENSIQRLQYDRAGQVIRMANTAHLFLRTRQALEENRPVVVESLRPLKAMSRVA